MYSFSGGIVDFFLIDFLLLWIYMRCLLAGFVFDAAWLAVTTNFALTALVILEDLGGEEKRFSTIVLRLT